MQENYGQALLYVLRHEGGWSDHPSDPGGATNKGVTLATFQRYYGPGQGKAELREITDRQVAHIYRAGYWNACRCGELSAGLDYVVFDQAVNSGPGRSIKWLQMTLGVSVDGVFGARTISAAQAAAAVNVTPRVITTMCQERIAFLKGIRNGAQWQVFGRGWQERVEDVERYGQALAAGNLGEQDAGYFDSQPVVDFEIVRRGSRGDWVAMLQAELGISADGDFGPRTEEALKAYQREAGLFVDGVAGRNTFQSLGLLGEKDPSPVSETDHIDSPSDR